MASINKKNKAKNSYTFFYADKEIKPVLNLIEIGYDAEISR